MYFYNKYMIISRNHSNSGLPRCGQSEGRFWEAAVCEIPSIFMCCKNNIYIYIHITCIYIYIYTHVYIHTYIYTLYCITIHYISLLYHILVPPPDQGGLGQRRDALRKLSQLRSPYYYYYYCY